MSDATSGLAAGEVWVTLGNPTGTTPAGSGSVSVVLAHAVPPVCVRSIVYVSTLLLVLLPYGLITFLSIVSLPGSPNFAGL